MKKFLKLKYVVFDAYGYVVGQHRTLKTARQNVKTEDGTIYKLIYTKGEYPGL